VSVLSKPPVSPTERMPQAYELVNSRTYFFYKINQKFGLSEDENMLYQMMLFSGEELMPDQLSVCPLAGFFSTSDCTVLFMVRVPVKLTSTHTKELERKPEVFIFPLERWITAFANVEDTEV
jgi:hypothetical protein